MRLYPSGLTGFDWQSDSLACLLLRTTSPDPADEISFDPFHSSVADLWDAGAMEVDVAGYARKPLAVGSPVIDTIAGEARFDAADLDFGVLASGQNVYALVLFREGSDDEVRTLVAFDNGSIPLVLAADVAAGSTLLWIEPLVEDLPSGAAIDLGNDATGSLASAAPKGTRSISLTAPGLSAAANAGDRCESVRTARVSTQATPPALAYLNNGPLEVVFDAAGVLIIQSQGG